MGLCFGGGQIALGLELLALGLFVLSTLRWVERRFFDERHATLTLSVAQGGPGDEDVRGALGRAGFAVLRCAVERDGGTGDTRIELDLRWRSRDETTPAVIREWVEHPAMQKARWDPKS
jgi:putative Mg2+ transporter-C (MgtC) family protein